MNTNQLLGLTGATILFVGVFTPIVSVPIYGNINYFQNGKGYGAVVFVLALISLVLVLAKKYRGLWFTGVGCLGVMLFSFINFHSKMSEAKAEIKSDLAGNPFSGLAEIAIQSVQVQWGLPLLLVGASLIIASAAIKTEDQEKPQQIKKLNKESALDLIRYNKEYKMYYVWTSFIYIKYMKYFKTKNDAESFALRHQRKCFDNTVSLK